MNPRDMAEQKFVGMIFTHESVNRIRAGRKTMTRRVMKSRVPLGNWEETVRYAPCKEGDIIYVKETYGFGTRPDPVHGCVDGIEFLADAYLVEDENESLPLWPCGTLDFGEKACEGWQNRMYMPKTIARLFLKVTSVTVERLRDISYADCCKEGVRSGFVISPDGSYESYGESRQDAAINVFG